MSVLSPADLDFIYSTDGTANNIIRTDTFTPVLNQYYHFAVTRDGSDDIRIFIDGVLRKTTNIGAVSIFNSTAVLTIADPWQAEVVEDQIMSYIYALIDLLEGWVPIITIGMGSIGTKAPSPWSP